MSHRIVFSPEALEQLTELFRYLAEEASADIAARYTEGIVRHCESLRTFPHRGTKHDDIRIGLRITPYKRRVVIAFSVDDEAVSIIGIFYGGRDYEAILQGETGDGSE